MLLPIVLNEDYQDVVIGGNSITANVLFKREARIRAWNSVKASDEALTRAFIARYRG